jgi:hypothetical protein
MLFPFNYGVSILCNSVQLLRTASQDLGQDLKSTRWLRGFGWFFGVLLYCGLLLSLGLLAIGAVTIFRSDLSACQGDGSFRLNPRTYSTWSSSGFFQITLGGGAFTFAQAKAIDIVWDIVG